VGTKGYETRFLASSRSRKRPNMLRWTAAALLATGFCVGAGCGSSTPVASDGSADRATGHGGAGGGGSAGTGGGAAGRTGSGQAGNGDTDGGDQAGRGGQMACTTSADCGRRGGVCDTVAGQCVECLTTADCGGQKCDVASHSCVDCLANADCPIDAPACSSGHTCGTMCATSADCSNGQPVCQTSSHSCVECLVNADCGAGGVCQADLTCQ
jgi:Cys-rich repeat protein